MKSNKELRAESVLKFENSICDSRLSLESLSENIGWAIGRLEDLETILQDFNGNPSIKLLKKITETYEEISFLDDMYLLTDPIQDLELLVNGIKNGYFFKSEIENPPKDLLNLSDHQEGFCENIYSFNNSINSKQLDALEITPELKKLLKSRITLGKQLVK